MKKTLIVIGIILASLILLIGGFTVVLYQSSVQTYITSIAAKKISEALQSDVSIKHIHYRPLNNLKIDSVYISDQNRDTLVFIGQASLELNLLALFEQKVDIAEVELLDPYINLQTIADSTINC